MVATRFSYVALVLIYELTSNTPHISATPLRAKDSYHET